MDAWNKIESWELVLPPSRPSRRHLDWFRKHLGELSLDDPVAILGCTPELRDLLAKLGFTNVYLLERNLDFIEKMNQLRVTQNQETVLHGDWMQVLPDCFERFSAVLSDLTSGNVVYHKRSNFYSLIAESIRPGGMFCDKLLSHPIPHHALDQLIDKYEEEPLNVDTLNRFNCEAFFCSELLTMFGRVDTSRFYKHLDQMRLGPTVRAIVNQLPCITPRGMTWDYGRPWCRVRASFDSRLHCSDDIIEDGESPYARRLRCLRWDKPRSCE